MAAMRANARLQVGSASWIAEERASALQIAAAETEEFTFSARNEVDWLNEHMAEIFSKNQVNVAEIFKTPGKLRGKTPRTARKINPLETRQPLSDVFSSAPRGGPDPFRQIHFEKPAPTFQVAEDEPEQDEVVNATTSNVTEVSLTKPTYNAFDSGYYGSQVELATQPNEPLSHELPSIPSPVQPFVENSMVLESGEDDGENVEILGRDSEERRTTEGSFQSAKEEQTRNIPIEAPTKERVDREMVGTEMEKTLYPVLESPLQNRIPQQSSPCKRSPQRNTPAKSSPLKVMAIEEIAEMPQQNLPESPVLDVEPEVEEQVPEEDDDEATDDVQSPSDGSSPIRPIVRKSSLNFASLPAREPITTKKSIGNRVSRTSHIDQSRTSYYGRLTGGKSMGNIQPDNEDDDEMDVDQGDVDVHDDDTNTKMTRMHNKTSTQRLQDQISKLGQSQTNVRPSKSLVSNTTITAQASQGNSIPVLQETTEPKSPVRRQSPKHKERPPPGAFPEDEDDSWIGPPPTAAAGPAIFSPRPQMTKSHTTDVMEDIYGKASVAGSQFDIPKRGEQLRNPSPVREPFVPERTTSTLGHIKSVSASVIRSPKKTGDSPSNKCISVSNPTPSVSTINEENSTTPPKSPARSHRGSPLKAAKDKFSSILKSSRGLFASSAAVSAEAKSSALSPQSSRMGLRNAPSFEDALSQANDKNPIYPNLDAHKQGSQFSLRMPDSPFKSSARKTRASTEREEKRKEDEAREAREAKEAKEAQKMASQLEKARSKVREEAHKDFVEQERAAKIQKDFSARKEDEKLAKASQIDIPRATRSSPRKTKAQLGAEGIAAAAASTDELANKEAEMAEASYAMPPPAIPRPKSQIGRPGPKRPLKPAKEPLTKAKPPTVIRVDTGSQRGHQYHPSNATLSATLQESLSSSQQAGPSQGLRHKASSSSIQSKASSTSSFKSTAAKALEAAAKKKEQDEAAAQRKREAKQEIERQRAAIKEEERRKEEQQRRQEVEKQREVQRERERVATQADAKKTAQRQAIEKRRLEMEKAKETRAPPPAIRPQPSGDLTQAMLQEKALPPLPAQRAEANQPRPVRMNTAVQRTQEDSGRPASAMLHNTTKAPPKRPLQQDSEEHHSRPTIQRNGPSYQTEHQSKRRRTSENFDDDDDMTEPQPKMTAPPIRQSSSRQNPPKSLFPSGYASAPPPASNLQRSTLISQHNMNQPKAPHPMDMAQVSKAPIPFASTSNQGSSQHKTPARPGATNGGGKSAKSAAKSSPRYQNGENIVLPEIHTDSEDEDSDAGDFPVQGWTNSPDLRKALIQQETMNPAEIFGQPGPLNMEEVFSKSKDRWHKFRNRTSSANWSGLDRLTEDDVRKDLEARDKVRRQGGWTYDSMV